MNKLSQHISSGTQQLAAQAVVAAQAAGATLIAGLKTCDETSGGNLGKFELRVDGDAGLVNPKRHYRKHGTSPLSTCTGNGPSASFELNDSTPKAESGTQYPPRKGKGFISSLLNAAITVPSTALALSSTGAASGLFGVQEKIIDEKGSPVTKIWGNFQYNFQMDLMTYGPSAGCLVLKGTRTVSAKGLPSPLSSDPPTASAVGPTSHISVHDEPIPARCRWKRKIAGECLDIPGVTGTEYPITADDVGSLICVEFTPLNVQDDCGVAFGEIGPFELDAAFRKHLDNYLALGGTRFPVRLRHGTGRSAPHGLTPETSDGGVMTLASLRVDHGSQPSYHDLDDDEWILHISSTEVRLLRPGRKASGIDTEKMCSYGADYPRVILSRFDFTAFELLMDPDTKVSLLATTRSQRDLIALTLRCFHAQRWTANTALLQQAALSAHKLSTSSGSRTISSPGIPPPPPEFLPVDIFSMIQRLTAELHRSLEAQDRCIRERDRAHTEKAALEDDIAATLEAYQEILASNTAAAPHADNDCQPSPSNHDNDPHEKAGGLKQRAAYTAELESKVKAYALEAEEHLAEIQLLQHNHSLLEQRLLKTEHALSLQSKRHAFSDATVMGGLSGATTIGQSSTSPSLADDDDPSSMASNSAPQLYSRSPYSGSVSPPADTAFSHFLDPVEEKGGTRPTQSTGLRSVLGSLQPPTRPALGSTKQERFHSTMRGRTNQEASPLGTYERETARLRAENKELAENFLYIKSKQETTAAALEAAQEEKSTAVAAAEAMARSCQEKLLSTEARLKECEMQYDALQRELTWASTEKNRCLKKIDVLTRDTEKTQLHLQSRTKALLNTTQQLTIEKTAAEDYKRAHAEAVEALKGAQEKIQTLELQVAEKSQAIEKLEKSNETLRSRIRKLAVVDNSTSKLHSPLDLPFASSSPRASSSSTTGAESDTGDQHCKEHQQSTSQPTTA